MNESDNNRNRFVRLLGEMMVILRESWDEALEREERLVRVLEQLKLAAAKREEGLEKELRAKKNQICYLEAANLSLEKALGVRIPMVWRRKRAQERRTKHLLRAQAHIGSARNQTVA